jgi:hypothetical protein
MLRTRALQQSKVPIQVPHSTAVKYLDEVLSLTHKHHSSRWHGCEMARAGWPVRASPLVLSLRGDRHSIPQVVAYHRLRAPT